MSALLPADFGFTHPAYRPGQWDMAVSIAASLSPADLLIAPTGFGKSLTYMTIAALTGWRVGVLTATKSLQDQLTREFGQASATDADDQLVDVRGQSNYLCQAAADPNLAPGLRMFFRRGVTYTVRDGPCKRGIQCPLRDSGCTYYDRVREAARSRIFCTNYDFWLHNSDKMGPVDLLVMDEAHQAPDELADFLSFKLTPDHRRLLGGRPYLQGDDVKDWREWADWALTIATARLENEHDDKLAELKHQLDLMTQLLGAGEWVIEHQERGVVAFDCVNPEAFGRRWLWGGAKKTLMVSATVNMMTARALGMAAESVKLWEATSSFPVERRPVFVVQGATRLNFRSSEGEKRMWVNLIDRIIDSRTDRRGILHTTSFERAKYFAEHTRHRNLVHLNDSRSTTATVQKFISSGSGAILVSPSVTTGWDFPLDQCEYQIIGKIPFPDLRSKAAKVRNGKNKEWAGYSAAQVVVQASGRGMRSSADQCETFIVDGNFDWWWGQNRKFIPKWWQQAVVWVDLARLPVPPPRLARHQGACHGVNRVVY